MILDFLIAPVLSLPNIGAYAMFAVGIVMIYRASKVLNLAHGAMAMIPPYVVYTLNGWGVPALFAVPLGIVAGGALGWGIERIFVRRLRNQGVTAQTVGTVAALGLLIALASKVWGTTQLPAVRVFPEGTINVARATISYGQIGLFVVMLAVTGALLVLFQRTDLGLLMRGTAENRRAASLMGVDPDRITSLAWVMGGALAALAGIMLASITNLQPFTLSNQALPAFVAALLGGLESISGAALGAGAVGVIWGFAAVGPFAQLEGAREFFVFLLAVVVMAVRGRRLVAGEDVRAALSTGTTRLASKLPGARPAIIVGLLLFIAFGATAAFDVLGGANKGAIFLITAASLVLLTGWVGQISLGHAALVGIGAYGTGWLAAGLGIPFPLNLPFAGLVAAGVAALLGAVAVRVRGLYLAVATLIFSWAADAFLFRNAFITRHFRIDARPIGAEGAFPYFDFSSPNRGSRMVFFFVAFAIAGLILYAAANLRDSKTGRALFAVRGSEIAASSLGIDVIRYKVLAFSVSGFMAGIAGNLVMTEATAISPDQFAFRWSFFFLAIAVVGGLASLGGAVAAAVLFGFLDVVFFRVQALNGLLDIVSTALLAITLLAYSGGLARAGRSLVDLIGRTQWAVRALTAADHALDQILDDLGWFGDWVQKRTRRRLVLAGLAYPDGGVRTSRDRDPSSELPVIAGGSVDDMKARASSLVKAVPGVSRLTTPTRPVGAPALLDLGEDIGSRRDLKPDRADRELVLRADSITMRFGGLVAVSDVSLEVREGEVVGLIGPNGAGKSVTFNCVAGILTPTAGRIHLWGRDVTELPVHERAQLGVARTFQQIQLVPQLSAFDNLLVATHLQNATGFLSHVGASERAVEAEIEARTRVQRVVELLELDDVARLQVADLPFGILRMIEVARAMVTGFRFMMLDEPASGLDSSETERLIEILLRIRDLGVTLLLIEHDVKMVTSMSDYMYVLDRGQLICEGLPRDVQRDPAVISAYLGQPTEKE